MGERDAPETPAPPLPNTYWVEPGRLLAGEYPATSSRTDTLARLNKLLAAGVTTFVDLTEAGELPPYESLLENVKTATGADVAYVRLPIRDHSIPESREAMVAIHEYLDHAFDGGQCVYLHCHAGVGRTGTVLGCYFVQRGMHPDAALDQLNALWRFNARSRDWPTTPETDEQYAYVQGWQAPEQPAVEPESLPREDLQAARAVRDRYQGALVGLAVGDAIGATVQYRPAGSFPPLGDMIGGGPFEMPRGGWTDDTATALCVTESLIVCNGFDARDQINRYERWQREGHLSSTGQCVGITAGVARALATARWSGKPFAGSHDPTRLDKDALSRVAPAVLFFLADPRSAVEHAAEVARTTDQSPVLLDGCRYLASLMIGALQGASRQQLLSADYTPVEGLWNKRPLKPAIAAIAAGSYKSKSPPEIQGGGGVVEALEAVLWVLNRTQTFREGVLMAVNLGLDSDVTGAVFGQLGGAIYGIGAIPSGWRSGLLRGTLIEQLADRLLAASLEKMAT
jgi:ADP-ribosyl-[dinitrogen reductase] hydrolase